MCRHPRCSLCVNERRSLSQLLHSSSHLCPCERVGHLVWTFRVPSPSMICATRTKWPETSPNLRQAVVLVVAVVVGKEAEVVLVVAVVVGEEAEVGRCRRPWVSHLCGDQHHTMAHMMAAARAVAVTAVAVNESTAVAMLLLSALPPSGDAAAVHVYVLAV